MLSQFCPVLVVYFAACIQTGLSLENMEYGATMLEKAGRGVCSIEQIYPHLVIWCQDNMDFIKNYHHYHAGFLNAYQNPSPEQEHNIMVSWQKGQFESRINGVLGRYSSCNSFFAPENVDQVPTKDYSWRLGDGDAQYPYKAAAHCLLEKLEELHGKQALDHLTEQWGPPSSPKENEGEAQPQEETEDPAEEPYHSKFSKADFQYGIYLAEKVAVGICWIEKLNKPYPENDGGVSFIGCKKHNAYEKFLEACREQSPSEKENAVTHKECLETEVKNGIENYLVDYSSCFDVFTNVDEAPKKDYGAFFDDDEGLEYPYRAYTFCLLEVMEDRNGQQSLDDLKSKWENPKTLVETMLQRENDHRAWHNSPPLEINEELTKGAQKWADHLAAEVCEPTHMLSNNPEKRYNGSKCGENVLAHSDLTLSDDEMAVMAAVDWYKESELYPWPLFNGVMEVWTRNMVGHFTQSVWKETKLVGYAISRETETCKKIFVVARYWPTGNKFWKVGQEERTRAAFEKNVLPRI